MSYNIVAFIETVLRFFGWAELEQRNHLGYCDSHKATIIHEWLEKGHMIEKIDNR